MTSKIKKIYDSGLKNEMFIASIKAADNDKKPNILSSSMTKQLFAITYYGWLVGRYGTYWKKHL
jgi:hypothetical protein